MVKKKAIIIEDHLNEEYKKSVDSFKRIFKGAKIGNRVVSDELDDCVNPLIDEINSSNNIAKRLWQNWNVWRIYIRPFGTSMYVICFNRKNG